MVGIATTAITSMSQAPIAPVSKTGISQGAVSNATIAQRGVAKAAMSNVGYCPICRSSIRSGAPWIGFSFSLWFRVGFSLMNNMGSGDVGIRATRDTMAIAIAVAMT